MDDTTTGFPAKWHLKNKPRNSKPMTCHHPELCSASDWLCHVENLPQPIRSNTQIWSVWNFCACSQGNQWWHRKNISCFPRLIWILWQKISIFKLKLLEHGRLFLLALEVRSSLFALSFFNPPVAYLIPISFYVVPKQNSCWVLIWESNARLYWLGSCELDYPRQSRANSTPLHSVLSGTRKKKFPWHAGIS